MNNIKNMKVTFQNIYTNAAAIAVTGHLVIEEQVSAGINNNLPHNSLLITNQSTTCTLYVFLDNFSEPTKPDYIIFPSQTMYLGEEDGESFTTLFIKNTHATTEVAINELKVKVMTLKEVK